MINYPVLFSKCESESESEISSLNMAVSTVSETQALDAEYIIIILHNTDFFY